MTADRAACPTTGLDTDVCFGGCCVPASAADVRPVGFCELCWHNWYAHDDGDDDGDWCRLEGCACDGYVEHDDGSIEVDVSFGSAP